MAKETPRESARRTPRSPLGYFGFEPEGSKLIYLQ